MVRDYHGTLNKGKSSMLTQERLTELLNYNPETGHFTWAINRAQTTKCGAIAGTTTRNGYVRIMLDGKCYMSHRLAFLYMLGKFPTDQVDHINNDRVDNRWANLRPATRVENMRNVSSKQGSSSKYLGVSWNKRLSKWVAQIHINNKKQHIGLFVEEVDAAQAYNFTAYEYFGDFANLNLAEGSI